MLKKLKAQSWWGQWWGAITSERDSENTQHHIHQRTVVVYGVKSKRTVATVWSSRHMCQAQHGLLQGINSEHCKSFYLLLAPYLCARWPGCLGSGWEHAERRWEGYQLDCRYVPVCVWPRQPLSYSKVKCSSWFWTVCSLGWLLAFADTVVLSVWGEKTLSVGFCLLLLSCPRLPLV